MTQKRYEVATFPEGEAVITWPHDMSEKSAEEMSEWLMLLVRKVHKWSLPGAPSVGLRGGTCLCAHGGTARCPIHQPEPLSVNTCATPLDKETL